MRDHLLRRLAALGAPTQVQRATSLTDRPLGGAGRRTVAGGEVENVIGFLPGADRQQPAILLMSHYDTVASSPGAADDALGVATTLEVARALRAGPAVGRDVILLFTDGEEVGLLGARAFFAEHPLARHVGVVLNLEARGSSGPAIMFQTGPRNAALIDLMSEVAPQASANSLTGFVYGLLPNDTDFTVPLRRGLPGLNFAAVADQQDYHSASATPANLDPHTLQHMGDQTLSLTRALSAGRVEAAASDTVYFDAPGVGFVRYPPAAGWAVIVVGAALWALALARERRRGLRWASLAGGVGLWLGVIAASGGTLWIARAVMPGDASLTGLRRILVQFALFEAGIVLLATGAALLAAALMLRWRGRRETSPATHTGLGVALGVLASAAALQALAPPAAFPWAWTGLFAALGLAMISGDRRGPFGAAHWVALLLGVWVVAGLCSFGHLLIVTLGPQQPYALAPVAGLCVAALWPAVHALASSRGGRRMALLTLLAGATCLLAVHLRDPWTARSPQASQAIHVSDPERGQFFRINTLEALDPWSARALAVDGGPVGRGEVLEAFIPDAWRAPADAAPAARLQPTLTRTADGRAVLTLPRWAGRELRLTLRSSVAVTDVTVGGQAAPLMSDAGQESRLRWSGSGPLEIAFRPTRAGTLHMSAAVISDEPPGAATRLPARPTDVAPWGLGDGSVVISRFSGPLIAAGDTSALREGDGGATLPSGEPARAAARELR